MRKIVFVSVLLLVVLMLVPLTAAAAVPTGQITSPADGAYLNTNSFPIKATASEGTAKVTFAAFYDAAWHHVGTDMDGSDGYEVTMDVSGVADQSGIRVSAQFHDEEGNHTGHTVNNLTLDRNGPTGRITVPAEGGTMRNPTVPIRVEASDPFGIKQVEFNAFYDSAWHYLGTDADGGNGFGMMWDVTGIAEQSGMRVSIQVVDMAGNRTGHTVNNLTLDLP